MQTNIPPIIVTLLSGAVMWLLDLAYPVQFLNPVLAAVLALLLVFAGLMLAALAVLQFRTASTTVNPLNPGSATSLVTSGVFSISRNPMYLGMLLLLLGGATALGNPLNLLVVGGFVAFMNELQIKPEERAMEKLFTKEWQAYRQRVRRWL